MNKRMILSIFLIVGALASNAQKKSDGFTSIGPVKSTKSLPVWTRGETMQIKWGGGDPTKNVYLTLILRDPFSVKESIAVDIDNSGSFSWQVPEDIAVGVYEIYICDDAVSPLHWRYSQDFVIESKDYKAKSNRKSLVIKTKG